MIAQLMEPGKFHAFVSVLQFLNNAFSTSAPAIQYNMRKRKTDTYSAFFVLLWCQILRVHYIQVCKFSWLLCEWLAVIFQKHGGKVHSQNTTKIYLFCLRNSGVLLQKKGHRQQIKNFSKICFQDPFIWYLRLFSIDVMTWNECPQKHRLVPLTFTFYS